MASSAVQTVSAQLLKATSLFVSCTTELLNFLREIFPHRVVDFEIFPRSHVHPLVQSITTAACRWIKSQWKYVLIVLIKRVWSHLSAAGSTRMSALTDPSLAVRNAIKPSCGWSTSRRAVTVLPCTGLALRLCHGLIDDYWQPALDPDASAGAEREELVWTINVQTSAVHFSKYLAWR